MIAVLKFNVPRREAAELAARPVPSINPGLFAAAALLVLLACGAIEGGLLLVLVVGATIRGLSGSP
jgi:hypothetical protein